jgi:hypothetical protein
MPRTRRYILNTLTVVSLLLMVGVVGLWVDGYSYDTGGPLPVRIDEMYATFESTAKGVNLRFTDSKPYVTEWHHWNRSVPILGKGPLTIQSIFTFNPVPDISIAGFQFDDRSTVWYATIGVTLRDFELVIPHWFLTLIFATLPSIWLFKWNKRRKLGPTACSGCGYDLTDNESGVCSECGDASESEEAEV